jgi:hypothetical protein
MLIVVTSLDQPNTAVTPRIQQQYSRNEANASHYSYY